MKLILTFLGRETDTGGTHFLKYQIKVKNEGYTLTNDDKLIEDSLSQQDMTATLTKLSMRNPPQISSNPRIWGVTYSYNGTQNQEYEDGIFPILVTDLRTNVVFLPTVNN